MITSQDREFANEIIRMCENALLASHLNFSCKIHKEGLTATIEDIKKMCEDYLREEETK